MAYATRLSPGRRRHSTTWRRRSPPAGCRACPRPRHGRQLLRQRPGTRRNETWDAWRAPYARVANRGVSGRLSIQGKKPGGVANPGYRRLRADALPGEGLVNLLGLFDAVFHGFRDEADRRHPAVAEDLQLPRPAGFLQRDAFDLAQLQRELEREIVAVHAVEIDFVGILHVHAIEELERIAGPPAAGVTGQPACHRCEVDADTGQQFVIRGGAAHAAGTKAGAA